MSVVTAVVLLTGLTDKQDGEEAMLAQINRYWESPRLVWAQDSTIGKHPQANIAVGACNHLDQAEFLAYLRAFPWDSYDVGFAQVVMKGEHNEGFGLVDIYRDPSTDSPWTEP